MSTPSTESVPLKMRPIYDEIIGLTDAFCRTHLNDEYADVCRALAAKLSRKRPSPLEGGRVTTWAAAIVHTIGRVNFLFDKSQTALALCPRPTAGSYSIPPGITSIGPYAFVLCFGLTNLTFPASVTSIAGGQYGVCPFYTCSLLSAVYFEGNAPEDWAAFECVPATIYHLPGTAGWATTFSKRPTALWVLPYPVILTTTPSFGIQTNGFGFRISWATNVLVVVEASPSLSTPVWSPVSTNTLINGWSDFSDAEWTNYPARFYRIRSQ